MVGKILIILVATLVLVEVVEHLLLPLAALRGRRRAPLSGVEALVGRTVEVTRWEGHHGQVVLDGEYWSATCNDPLAAGNRATVEGVRGVILRVRRHAQPERQAEHRAANAQRTPPPS